MRIIVGDILKHLADGDTESECPQLEREDIRACLSRAEL